MTSWVVLFSTVCQLSLGQVAIYGATVRRREEWLPEALGTLLAFTLWLTVGGWFVAGALFAITRGRAFGNLGPGLLAIGFLSLPLLVWEVYGSSLLMALDKVTVYNRAQWFGRSTTLCLVLLTWWARGGVAGVLMATVVGQGVLVAFLLRHLVRRSGGRLAANRRTATELFRGGLKLHANFVGAALMASGTVLIINRYLGLTLTGEYQAAAALINVLFVVPQAVSMVLYGEVASSGPEAAWARQRHVILGTLGAMLVIGVASYLIAPYALPLVIGVKFPASVEIFRGLLFGLPGMTLASVMSAQWIGRGLFLQMSFLTVSLGALCVVGSLLLVPRWGVEGAVWAVVGANLAAAAIQLGMMARCERSYRRARVGGPVSPSVEAL